MAESILITGGGGLLGLNWAIAARSRYEVTLGVHARKVSLASVNSKELDLESTDAIICALKEIKPKFVIHAAGLTNVEKCESDPALALHVNVDLSRNIARACSKLGIKLVHISTDHMFSGSGQLLNEDEPVFPLNAYAQSKANAEITVMQEAPQSLLVRTNFYGWGPSYRQSFSDFVIQTLRSKKPLKLFQDVFYTPIVIEELVRVVEELLNSGASGVFNVVGDERISKYEFGLKIAKEFGLDASSITPVFFADQINLVKRPKDMSLSNFKVRNFLGRQLGGVEEHIKRLRVQEITGLVQEIQLL